MQQDVITCLECGQKNEAVNQACQHCGTWLGDAENQTLLSTLGVQLRTEVEDYLNKQITALELGAGEIALEVIDTEEILKLNCEKPLLLGRGEKTRLDDVEFIDLTDYGAYRFGLSRDHAQIQYIDGTYILIDLGSSNGTSLNKQEVIPSEQYPLKNDDQIFLGRLGLIFHCP